MIISFSTSFSSFFANYVHLLMCNMFVCIIVSWEIKCDFFLHSV